MRNTLLSLCAAAALTAMAASTASADTIFFRDGTTLDGKASRPHPNVVHLEVPGGNLSFPASSVLRIEENDKVGRYTLHTNPHTVRHITYMEDATGLTAEEKEEVFLLMAPLNSDDSAERHRAMQAVLAKAEQIDLVPFLTHLTTSVTERYLPQVLEILVTVDPARGRDVVREHLAQQHPLSRASAIELLARAAGPEEVDTVARGLVDPEPEVQVATAQVVADHGLTAATPALIEGLESPYARVRVAADQALRRLWDAPDGKSPDGWRAHWQTEGNAAAGVDVARLEPLLEKDDPLISTMHQE